jgi:uncharacterized protein with PIN domain
LLTGLKQWLMNNQICNRLFTWQAAKWLKIMGFDAHFQSLYQGDEIEKLLKEGRRCSQK